jgi:hypothetical protein
MSPIKKESNVQREGDRLNGMEIKIEIQSVTQILDEISTSLGVKRDNRQMK